MLNRVSPQNIEAEQALLAGLFLNPRIIPQVQNILSCGDFYRTSHELLFQAFCALKENSTLPAIKQWLEDKGLLEKAGGMDYLASLVDAVSTSVGWKYHSEIVKKLSTRRRVIELCSNISEKAFQSHEHEEEGELLSDLRAGIRGLQAEQGGQPYRSNRELVNAVWKDIESREANGNRFIGIRTGFENIDTETHGLESKTSTYLIARPSIGKTALALNISDYVAATYPGKVLFFSLESSDVALTRRRLASHSGVFLSRIRTGSIEHYQWPELTKASNKLSESNLIIIDHPKFKTVENLVTMAETIAMDGPLSLIVLDHIQRMRSTKKTQNRHLELSHISEELGSLAKEVNVPLLILCQLSREVEKRPFNRQYPQLSDMKESGDLEQNADMVWGLWRETKDSEAARLECLKGRDVGTWTAWLRFDRFTQKFSDGEEPVDEEAKYSEKHRRSYEP